MASIDIDNVSVSYFLRTKTRDEQKLDRGAVGGQILVRRNYVEILALRDISLRFQDGDRVALIGLNGSGKSTLLKLCANALAVQSGSITIKGQVGPHFSLGAGLRGGLSGRRNAELKCLYMGIAQRSISDRVERVKELSGLGGYFELPMSSYSAGMKSRLVMAMMSLVKAEILVMDEWIGASDTTVGEKASMLQAELISSARIVILASHSRSILEAWTTRVVWLDGGEIKMEGPTADILNVYYAQNAPTKKAAKPKRLDDR